ncbi:hypothetical protein DVH24_034516 [Malus domestica]|uniref:Uncharacterized protein n=1 Tax=Malus domestica TaxID=3750 RepID=A0A498IWQ1_MALDO|nr:hypothetical protein DVH24_034516 [Malus domestica]
MDFLPFNKQGYVENPSSGEGSIPRAMRRNKARRNTLNYTPMSKAYFDRKKEKEIMTRRLLFTFDYTPTTVDDEDNDDFRY